MPSITVHSFLSAGMEDIEIGAVSSAYSSPQERSHSWVRSDVRVRLRVELEASMRVDLHPSPSAIPLSIPPPKPIFILFGWAEGP